MAQDGQVLWAVSQAGAVLVFVHDDIEPPVQLVLDPPMRPGDLVQAVGEECGAEQVVGGLGRCPCGGLADAMHLADGGQPRPGVPLLQPADVGRDGGRACLNPAVAGIDGRLGRGGLGGGVIKEADDVIVQRALIAFQRQGVVATLIDDLPGRGAWQCNASAVTIVPWSDSRRSRAGTAVISFDLASVATCASTSRCSHPQALTMCSADLPLARSNERRRTLPSMATTPGAAAPDAGSGRQAAALLGEPGHEAPERGAERLRVKLAEQAAERVVARHPVGERQDAPQARAKRCERERLLGLREQRHVHRTLPAAQHRAQRDEQKLVEVMQGGIASPRIVQLVPARRKLVQGTTPMPNQRPKK